MTDQEEIAWYNRKIRKTHQIGSMTLVIAALLTMAGLYAYLGYVWIHSPAVKQPIQTPIQKRIPLTCPHSLHSTR